LLNPGDTLKEQLRLEDTGGRRHISHVHSLGDSFFSVIIVDVRVLVLGATQRRFHGAA
jgi:hypothetical protein